MAKTSGQQLPDPDSVLRWVGEAGPEPEDAVLREWLRSQVPEYHAQ